MATRTCPYLGKDIPFHSYLKKIRRATRTKKFYDYHIIDLFITYNIKCKIWKYNYKILITSKLSRNEQKMRLKNIGVSKDIFPSHCLFKFRLNYTLWISKLFESYYIFKRLYKPLKSKLKITQWKQAFISFGSV